MIRTPKLVLALCAALLTSCVLPPKDAPHEQAIGDTALGLSTATMPAVGDGWWHAYQDPQLDRLVEASLANNPTLAQAMARV
ncbi:MAG: RND transporter, partial [Nevskiales bacterium]